MKNDKTIISHSKEIYLLESTQSLLISYNFCESILNQFHTGAILYLVQRPF